jgi:hypothetical protein
VNGSAKLFQQPSLHAACAPVPASERPSPSHALLSLQQTAGNQAVTRLVQRRLAVGASSDPSEREADQLTDAILSGGSALPKTGGCPDCTPDAPCSKCLGQAPVVRRAPLTREGGALSLPDHVMAGLGAGQPLEPATRALFEERLGLGLGGVRIHQGAAANVAAQSIRAAAFTSGEDIVFAAGLYRPETGSGRRLIAHELVHVAQQRATPAASPVAQRDGLLDYLVPPAPTNRELIDYALKTRDAADVKMIPNVGEATVAERIQLIEILLNQFWVGPLDEYKLEEIWKSFGDWLIEIGSTHADLWNKSVARGAELANLEPVVKFTTEFQQRALATTSNVLKDSENAINAERVRYGLPSVEEFEEDIGWDIYGEELPPPEMSKGPSAVGLAAAAKVLLNKRRAIADIHSQRRRLVHHRTYRGDYFEWIADPALYNRLGEEAAQAQREYDVLRGTMEQRFPILAVYADAGDDALEALASGPNQEAAKVLWDTIREKIDNIHKVRADLEDEPEKVWKLAPIVSLTKHDMGIDENSLRAGFVYARIDQIESDESLINLALGALAIGFGILAALPTGGSSLVAAAAVAGTIGTVAVSSYTAFAHLQQYEFEKAASGTDFDKANAVSTADPSLFWLAVDIIAAGVDLGAATGVFEALGPAAHLATEAKTVEEADSAVKALRSAAEQEAERLGKPALTEAVVQSAEKLRAAESVEKAFGAAGKAEQTVEEAIATAEKGLEEGRIGAHPAADAGHQIKATEGGWIVRCSDPCMQLREAYARQLAETPSFEERLKQLEEAAAAGEKDLDSIAGEAAALEKDIKEQAAAAEAARAPAPDVAAAGPPAMSTAEIEQALKQTRELHGEVERITQELADLNRELGHANAGSALKLEELDELIGRNPQLAGLANIDLTAEGGVEAARRWLNGAGRQGRAFGEAKAVVNRYGKLRAEELLREQALKREIGETLAKLDEAKKTLASVPEAAAKQAAFERLDYAALKDDKAIICFPPGTPVKTPAGDSAIEALCQGDRVISFDEPSAAVAVSAVAGGLRNWTRHLVELELEGETLRATRQHYFYLHDQKRWVQARQLYPGLRLRGMDGAPCAIGGVRTIRESTVTHNLTVAEYHTFFVGRRGVVVHNEEPGELSNFASKDRAPGWIYGIKDKATGEIIYVGKTRQVGGIDSRFRQHMQKKGWTRTEYEWVSLKEGEWTDFETAVHEQHEMMIRGGPKSLNDKTPLLNEISAITEEKFNEYRKPEFGHNPCR